ncbi:MAG TPA: FAD-dependent monooxygenase [Steroidobacteraceae bacterium]|nr:FAD-dependent monooxygenase [Steroidobacteraceae bacterium]
MKHEVDVAVLGAGPAGVAAAISLQKLGHSVMLLGVSRNTSVEGLSQRAHALLTRLGLNEAATVARGPGKRSGTWAGAAVGMNTEYVVDRIEFDDALSRDAASHDLPLQPVWITAVEKDSEAWCVRTRSGVIRCRAVVDARGRRIGRGLQRGPSLVAIAQRLAGVGARLPRTMICPMESGWCWFAGDDRGAACVQLVTSSPGLSVTRAGLSQLVLTGLSRVFEPVGGCGDVIPVGVPEARAATARRVMPSGHEGYVRAGDAAVACDPLSGHGLYEALRSASVAAAAVHTYLTRNAWDAVARFLTESSEELWASAINAAAAFYQQQAACTPTPFWTRTARLYAALRPAQPRRDGSRVESRPVLNGSLIEMRDVVVTAERPRGVWQLDAVELAGVIEFFHNEPTADVERAAHELERQPAAIINAVRWLTAHGLLRGCKS